MSKSLFTVDSLILPKRRTAGAGGAPAAIVSSSPSSQDLMKTIAYGEIFRRFYCDASNTGTHPSRPPVIDYRLLVPSFPDRYDAPSWAQHPPVHPCCLLCRPAGYVAPLQQAPAVRPLREPELPRMRCNEVMTAGSAMQTLLPAEKETGASMHSRTDFSQTMTTMTMTSTGGKISRMRRSDSAGRTNDGKGQRSETETQIVEKNLIGQCLSTTSGIFIVSVIFVNYCCLVNCIIMVSKVPARI